MSRKPYTRYSREFKLEAVRQASLGEKPKAQIARVLGIRVGHLRDWRARGRAPSARQQRQATLTAEIRKIHTASRETYGAPRVHAEFSAQKVVCCRNTVAKLMRQAFAGSG